MTTLFTVFALLGFAANSILCRLALGSGSVDAATFTLIRLVAGAVALLALQGIAGSAGRKPKVMGLAQATPAPTTAAVPTSRDRWISAALLFLYAGPFSYAYLSLGVATGALILFPSAQFTLLVGAILAGEKLHAFEAIGIAVALAGFIYLISPGLHAPSPAGSALMVVAGIAWGLYSLRGRGSRDPIGATTGNFMRSVPFALLVVAVAFTAHKAHVDAGGTCLAVASGAIASGLGYVSWYAALRHLSAIRAAALQVTVPIIAALGGFLLLSEPLTTRLLVSAPLILIGVALAIGARLKSATPRTAATAQPPPRTS
jgi:drug/metabolite transporter (DMT)-like permease